MNDTQLNQVLRLDPLDLAERITGESYKDSPETESLGMFLALNHNQHKQSILEEAKDVSFRTSLVDYIRIMEEEGFQKVLDIPVPHDPDHEFEGEDRYFIFWHPDGLLLSFDSYRVTSVNGGEIYFNYVPNDDQEFYRLGLPLSGYHKCYESLDCREAIRYYLRVMRENGKFLPVWEETPFLWLLHYMDTEEEGYDYKAITKSRLDMLPMRVREMVGKE